VIGRSVSHSSSLVIAVPKPGARGGAEPASSTSSQGRLVGSIVTS
jgi:hypothetical protein